MKKLKLIIYPAKRINASVTTAYVTNTVSRLHVQYVTEFCCCWRALLLDHLLSDSVHNMKNVKALWEWLKYWLYVGYETSSVLRKATETEISGLTFWLRFGFLTETEPKFGFRTSLGMTHQQNFCYRYSRHRIIPQFNAGHTTYLYFRSFRYFSCYYISLQNKTFTLIHMWYENLYKIKR